MKYSVSAIFQKSNLRRKVDFGGRGYAVLHANWQISMRQRCTASLTSTIAGTETLVNICCMLSCVLPLEHSPHCRDWNRDVGSILISFSVEFFRTLSPLWGLKLSCFTKCFEWNPALEHSPHCGDRRNKDSFLHKTRYLYVIRQGISSYA